MPEKRKNRLGDRKDAYLVRDLDPLHNIMNNLMGERTANEAVVKFDVDLTALNKYLADKNENCTDSKFKYTFFHAVLAAFARTIQERKVLNYFIRNKKFYERKEISFSYIAKKNKADGAEESVMIHRYNPDSNVSPIQQMHDKSCKEVSDMRQESSKGSDSDKIIKAVLKLPSFVLNPFFVILRWLDKKGRVPMSLHKLIPYYSTIFVANLGSIGLNSEYHHLINFGTNSIFAIIGKKKFKTDIDKKSEPVIKEFLPIVFTVDERIADGIYYINSIKMIKHLLENPELLDTPANIKIDFQESI